MMAPVAGSFSGINTVPMSPSTTPLAPMASACSVSQRAAAEDGWRANRRYSHSRHPTVSTSSANQPDSTASCTVPESTHHNNAPNGMATRDDTRARRNNMAARAASACASTSRAGNALPTP